MKNSKEYSKKIQKFYRSLKGKHAKVEKVTYEEPADALVYGIVSENLKEKASQWAIRRFRDYFVDLNDLRVSRAEEILEMLGEDSAGTRAAAGALTKVLRGIFNEYHRVSLDSLKKMGKRPARQVLEKMEGISPFVVDYIMLTSLQGHAIPLTKDIVEHLRDNELVHPQADESQIGGFLAKQIPARSAYEFYILIREASEAGTRRGTRKSRASAGKSKAGKAITKNKK